MDISQISTAVLKNILKLTEKREALLSELATIDSAITSLYGGKAASKAVAAPAKKAGRRPGRPRAAAAEASSTESLPSTPTGRPARRAKSTSRRGALKESILEALRAAGEKGVSVKELSESLGVKNQNVHVWFSSTGRKLGTVQKLSAGRYRLKAGA